MLRIAAKFRTDNRFPFVFDSLKMVALTLLLTLVITPVIKYVIGTLLDKVNLKKTLHRVSIFFLALVLLVTAALYVNNKLNRSQKPNIVLIVIDTLRADHLPFSDLLFHDLFHVALLNRHDGHLLPHAPGSHLRSGKSRRRFRR